MVPRSRTDWFSALLNVAEAQDISKVRDGIEFVFREIGNCQLQRSQFTEAPFELFAQEWLKRPSTLAILIIITCTYPL